MADSNALGWGLFAFGVLLVFAFVFFLVRYYSDPRESSKLSKTVVGITIIVLLLCMLLIPVDVFISSYNTDPHTGAQVNPSLTTKDADAIRYMYYVLYVAVVFLGFFLLPFSYFLYEEDDDDSTPQERICGALKYTFVFVVIMIVLALVGAFLKGGVDEKHKWIAVLNSSYHTADAMISFFVGCLTTVGMLGMFLYTAFGMAYLPISLVRSGSTNSNVHAMQSRFLTNPDEDLDFQLKRNNERLKFLTARYSNSASTNSWSQQDRIKLHELQREERRLKQMKDHKQNQGQNQGSFCASCWDAFWWLRAVVGIFLYGVSLLIIVSLILTTVDKALHSECRTSCGYAIDTPSILNPINSLLVYSSKVFPIDYIIFGGIMVYLFLCTISGLCSLGIRLVCVTFHIRKQRTLQNSLLLMGFVLIFVVLALNAQSQNLAPQYTSFGTQFYLAPRNTTTGGIEFVKTDCSFDQIGADNQCVLTQVSRFTHRLTSEMPFFGVIFYYSTWVFIGSFFLCSLYVLLCRKETDQEGGGLLEDAELFDA